MSGKSEAYPAMLNLLRQVFRSFEQRWLEVANRPGVMVIGNVIAYRNLGESTWLFDHPHRRNGPDYLNFIEDKAAFDNFCAVPSGPFRDCMVID